MWANIVKNEHSSRLSEVVDYGQKDWDSVVNPLAPEMDIIYVKCEYFTNQKR